jgi:hypothetical protein
VTKTTETVILERIALLIDKADVELAHPERMTVLRLSRNLALAALRKTPRAEMSIMADYYPALRSKAVAKAIQIVREVRA